MSLSSSAPWLKYYGNVPHHLSYPQKTIYQMVKAAAERNPKLPAYEFMGKKTTFTQFMQKIDETAQAFLAMGIKKGDRVTTIGGMVGKIVQVNDSTIVFETSEDRVRIEVTKWAVQSTGAMEQAAAQKSGKKADKVEEKAEETPAVEEKATETVEAPTAEEKPSYDPEIK